MSKKFAVAILLSLPLVTGLPDMPALYVAVGMLVGLAIMLAEVRWPSDRSIYVNPVDRPKPLTSATVYRHAAIAAAASGVIGLIAWAVPSSSAPTSASVGIYAAGLCAGMAIGIVLTARRAVDAHNHWLAAMAPDTRLES